MGRRQTKEREAPYDFCASCGNANGDELQIEDENNTEDLWCIDEADCRARVARQRFRIIDGGRARPGRLIVSSGYQRTVSVAPPLRAG